MIKFFLKYWERTFKNFTKKVNAIILGYEVWGVFDSVLFTGECLAVEQCNHMANASPILVEQMYTFSVETENVYFTWY